jgi:hypothetical protein
VRGRSASLFEQAGVALQEEDVEEEIERERAKVDEGSEQAPVLLSCMGSTPVTRPIIGTETNLTLHKHGAKTIKQLKRSDDMALHKNACHYRRGCPCPGADWHLVEPSLKWHLSLRCVTAPSLHRSHDCGSASPRLLLTGEYKGLSGLGEREDRSGEAKGEIPIASELVILYGVAGTS